MASNDKKLNESGSMYFEDTDIEDDYPWDNYCTFSSDNSYIFEIPAEIVSLLSERTDYQLRNRSIASNENSNNLNESAPTSSNSSALSGNENLFYLKYKKEVHFVLIFAIFQYRYNHKCN